jgi:hypothetical protein
MYCRFDKFNLKYNPFGQSRLREIFIKQVGGRGVEWGGVGWGGVGALGWLGNGCVVRGALPASLCVPLPCHCPSFWAPCSALPPSPIAGLR